MENYFGRPITEQDIRNISVSDSNAFMTRVFMIMGFGLAISGLTAFLFAQYLLSNPQVIMQVFGGGMKWVIMLAPFAFILALSFGINKMNYATASLVFGAFALVMGISLSSIFLVYSGSSIALTFFVAAAMFGGMVFYGLTTKQDLTKMGSYLRMALFGLIIAIVVNIFLGSSMLEFIISIVGVVVFTGLTAYNTQEMLALSLTGGAHTEAMKKASVLGALSLYLNFINLFLMLLRLLGNRE